MQAVIQSDNWASVHDFLLQRQQELQLPSLIDIIVETNAIYYAADLGAPNVMEMLLKHVDNPEQINTAKGKPYPPLHAALGKCHLRTSEILLAAGASVLKKTYKGKNALDLARNSRSKKMMLIYPLLERRAQEEIQQRLMEAEKSSKPMIICRICGEKIRNKTQMHYLTEALHLKDGAAAAGDESGTILGMNKSLGNALVREGVERFGVVLRETREYHRAADVNDLTKEIAESMACVKAVETMWKKMQRANGQDLVIVDLCSGVGLTALLMSLAFPEAKVLAVDRMSSMAYANHTIPGGSIEYIECDVFNVENKLREKLAGGKVGLLVGMHLCGFLSLQAIHLFRIIPEFCGIVLCPCCLPDIEKSSVCPRAKRLKTDFYKYWSCELHIALKSDPQVQSTNLIVDVNLSEMTERSSIITAIKQQ